jgi:putative sterol carrier protein
MSDATAAFFDALAQRGNEPLLRMARGTVRFDIVSGGATEHRYVTIDRGDIDVSKKRTSADGVIRVERAVFDRLASGEMNPIAAVLRGEFVVEGDWRILVLVQRLMPGSEEARGPRRHAGWAKRQR